MTFLVDRSDKHRFHYLEINHNLKKSDKSELSRQHKIFWNYIRTSSLDSPIFCMIASIIWGSLAFR